MLTSEQYDCGTHADARAVADRLANDGWIGVASRGEVVYFDTVNHNPDAHAFVAAVAATVTTDRTVA